jgi:hypothetical protein
MSEPIQLFEVALTEEQLKQALLKIKETKAETVSVVSSNGRLVGIDTAGGFDLKPSSFHCMYGKQGSETGVLGAIKAGFKGKQSGKK